MIVEEPMSYGYYPSSARGFCSSYPSLNRKYGVQDFVHSLRREDWTGGLHENPLLETLQKLNHQNGLKPNKISSAKPGPRPFPGPKFFPQQIPRAAKSNVSNGITKDASSEQASTPNVVERVIGRVNEMANSAPKLATSGQTKLKRSVSEVARRKTVDEGKAAVIIQSRYRGYSVRRSRPLKHMRVISQVVTAFKECQAQVLHVERQEKIRAEPMEKLKVSESLMSLLLQLDSIQDAHPTVREVRKTVTREVVQLQEQVDAIASGIYYVAKMKKDETVEIPFQQVSAEPVVSFCSIPGIEDADVPSSGDFCRNCSIAQPAQRMIPGDETLVQYLCDENKRLRSMLTELLLKNKVQESGLANLCTRLDRLENKCLQRNSKRRSIGARRGSRKPVRRSSL